MRSPGKRIRGTSLNGQLGGVELREKRGAKCSQAAGMGHKEKGSSLSDQAVKPLIAGNDVNLD